MIKMFKKLDFKKFIDNLGESENLDKEIQKFEKIKKNFYILFIIFIFFSLFLIFFAFTGLILLFYLSEEDFTIIEYLFSIFSLVISVIGILFSFIGIFFAIYFFNLSWNFQDEQNDKNFEMLEKINKNTYKLLEIWNNGRNPQEKEEIPTSEMEINMERELEKLGFLKK